MHLACVALAFKVQKYVLIWRILDSCLENSLFQVWGHMRQQLRAMMFSNEVQMLWRSESLWQHGLSDVSDWVIDPLCPVSSVSGVCELVSVNDSVSCGGLSLNHSDSVPPEQSSAVTSLSSLSAASSHHQSLWDHHHPSLSSVVLWSSNSEDDKTRFSKQHRTKTWWNLESLDWCGAEWSLGLDQEDRGGQGSTWYFTNLLPWPASLLSFLLQY